MGISTMTLSGESHIPNGWTGQIDSKPSLESKRPLENKVITEALNKIDNDILQLLLLRADLSGTAGLVTLTDAADVTETDGLALSAREKNPTIPNSIANQISELKNLLKPIRYIFKSSEITNGVRHYENSVTKFYGGICAINVSAANAVLGGGNILVIPDGFRPKYLFTATASGNMGERVMLTFRTDGSVSIHSSEGEGAFGMFFYLSE